MTEPTDNELDIVLSKHWPAFATVGALPLIWIRAAFRDAIAKCGAPPDVGEPVAWLSVDCIGERYLCFTKPDDSDSVRPLVFGDTTPQPTQAHAGTVPLTDEQIVGVMHSIPINAAPSYHIAFARAIEAAHGIGETP